MVVVRVRSGRWFVVVGVVVALAGGCEGHDDSDSAEPSVASSSSTSTIPIDPGEPSVGSSSSTSAIPIDPADEGRANAAVLTIEDLNTFTVAEWSPHPREEEADDPDLDASWDAIAEGAPACGPALAAAEDEGTSIAGLEIAPDALVRGESPTFVTQVNGSEVEHTVSVYPTGDEAAATFSAVTESGVLDCLAATFGELMQAAYDRDDIGLVVADTATSVEELDLADDAIRVRVALLLQAPDEPDAVLYLDASSIRVDRVTTSMFVIDINGEIGDHDALIAWGFGKTVDVWAEDGTGETDHLVDLASGESAFISRKLVEVGGYDYVDADAYDIAYSVLRFSSREADLGARVFNGFSSHSVVADDPSQNTTQAGAGYREVGYLRLYEFSDPAHLEDGELFADEFCVGEPLAPIELADTQLFVFDDPTHPDSRFHYCWIGDGVGGVIDGADREPLERWLTAYLDLLKAS